MTAKLSVDTSNTFQRLTFSEHVGSRSMWAGTHAPISYTYPKLCDNGSIVFAVELISPAFVKIFDELIVNIIDHNQLTKSVKNVSIVLYDNGKIDVMNDGLGIPCKEVYDNIDKKNIPIPTLLCSKEMSGGNFLTDDTKRITGGVNGLGLPIVNALSSEFTIITCDTINKIVFMQQFTDNMKIIKDPIINDLSILPKEHFLANGGTIISYLPDYKKFSIDITSSIQLIKSLIISRLILASVYMNSINYTFNKVQINMKLDEFMQAITKIDSNSSYMITEAKHKMEMYSLAVGFIISDMKLINNISIITGSHVFDGFLIEYFTWSLVSLFSSKVEKHIKNYQEFKSTMISNNIRIVIVGIIPGTQFSSQDKTSLSSSAHKMEEYKLNDKSIIQTLWSSLSKIIDHKLETKTSKQKKVNLNRIKGYTAAYDKLPKNACRRTLWLVEGTSAAGPIDKALRNKSVADGGTLYNSIFELRGVIINTYKESKRITESSGSFKFILSNKLRENERLHSLSQILGLSLDKQHITEHSISRLTHHRIIITTDQDVDGVGNICGLLLQHIRIFWPALITYGHIFRLSTPLIRCIPSNKSLPLLEFETQQEYDKWHSSTDKTVVSKYKSKYIKGLSGHDNKDMVRILSVMDKWLVKYDTHHADEKIIDAFYGDDTDIRKKIIINSKVEINPIRKSSVTIHLTSETLSYFLENSIRKLVSCLDGTRNATLKVLSYALLHKNIDDKKIFKLSGSISDQMQYHHGPMSMEKVIINMTKDFVGNNNITIPFIGNGNFGSRCKSGIAGEARYIGVTYNKLTDYIFRNEDRSILTRKLVDGEQAEFEYLLPIVPYFLFHKYEHVPANGWKYQIWPRNIKDVITNVLLLINARETIHMKPYIKGWNGTFRLINGIEYAVGGIKVLNSNTIEITEIPPTLYINEYIRGKDKDKDDEEDNKTKQFCLFDSEIVEDVLDNCIEDDENEPDKVSIIVKLKPNAASVIDKIETHHTFSKMESYFKLYQAMHHHLNMIDKTGKLCEFESYDQLLKYWFNERKQFYIMRVERDIAYNCIYLDYLREKIRFIELHSTLDLSKHDEEKMMAILEDNKFKKFGPFITSSVKAGRTPLEVYDNLTKNDISYNYLLSMSYKSALNKSKKVAIQKEIDEIIALINKYKSYKSSADYAIEIWRNEIAELVRFLDIK